MKKKGFTLIELLAVIIILAILSVLVITVISRTVNSTAEKLYKNQVDTIIEASRSYVLRRGYTSAVTLCDLKGAGLLAKDIKDPRTEKLFDDALLVTISKDLDGNYHFMFDGVTKEDDYTCEYE